MCGCQAGVGWPFKKAVTVYASASGIPFSAVQFEGSKAGISGTHHNNLARSKVAWGLKGRGRGSFVCRCCHRAVWASSCDRSQGRSHLRGQGKGHLICSSSLTALLGTAVLGADRSCCVGVVAGVEREEVRPSCKDCKTPGGGDLREACCLSRSGGREGKIGLWPSGTPTVGGPDLRGGLAGCKFSRHKRHTWKHGSAVEG